MWEDDRKKHLWDQKNKMAVEKIIDKNPSTIWLELKMSYYKNMIAEFDEMPVERNAFFIGVSFASVISSFKNQAKEWLDKHGNVLRTMGERELKAIVTEVSEYREKLKEDPPRIEELKALLNQIRDIQDLTMNQEFRIHDVMERFRTLAMYNQKVETAKMEHAFRLDQDWKDLVREAKIKDYMLIDVKRHFAAVTQ